MKTDLQLANPLEHQPEQTHRALWNLPVRPAQSQAHGPNFLTKDELKTSLGTHPRNPALGTMPEWPLPESLLLCPLPWMSAWSHGHHPYRTASRLTPPAPRSW